MAVFAQPTRGWKPLAIFHRPDRGEDDSPTPKLARRVNVRRIVAHHYIWKPSPEIVEYSNIGRFMRRHGITSYRELISIDPPPRSNGSGKAAVEDLDIQFFRPFDAVLDASRGIAWTQWFCGGTINLAHQCLDRHARSGRHEHTAVIAEGEDGITRACHTESSTPRLAAWPMRSRTSGSARAMPSVCSCR